MKEQQTRPRVVLVVVLVLCAAFVGLMAQRSSEAEVHQGHAAAVAPSLREDGNTMRSASARRSAPVVGATVDGSQKPEAIPDDVAYGHFIRATVRTRSTRDLDRRTSMLRAAGLNHSEQAAYGRAMGGLEAELEGTRRLRREAGRAAAQSVLEALQRTESQAIDAARGRLRFELPPDAAAKLDAHIQNHVKRRITIHRGPMQLPQ